MLTLVDCFSRSSYYFSLETPLAGASAKLYSCLWVGLAILIPGILYLLLAYGLAGMAAPETQGNIPFIVVDGHDEPSPPAGGGSPGGNPSGPGDKPRFQEAGISAPAENYPHETELERLDDVSARRQNLYLHQDQEAENPINTDQMQPELAHIEDAYEDLAGPPLPYSRTQPEQAQPIQPSHPPPRVSETITGAARETLRRATSSMKEGVRHATVHVVHAGEKVGQAWNKTLDSAMWVCAICGAVALILLAVGAPLRTWRYQQIEYEDDNGYNISRVELGLQTLQRIQGLRRIDGAGLVTMYDPPLLYQDAITSAYCVHDVGPSAESSEGSYLPDRPGALTTSTTTTGITMEGSESPGGAAEGAETGDIEAAEERPQGGDSSEGAPQGAEPSYGTPEEPGSPSRTLQGEGASERREPGTEASEGITRTPITGEEAEFMPRLLQSSGDDTPQWQGPLADPPPYNVTFGRNPASPGGLSEKYVEMREQLLGPTIFDLHCKDLKEFKSSGALFCRMAIAYGVFAGVGMIAAIGSLALAPLKYRWSQHIKEMPMNLVGTVAWLVALVVQLSAIAAWGVGTDVAACVTQEGGAAVCPLGIAMALVIASLVFTLIATLSYSVFFTHKFIRDLGLERDKQKEQEQHDAAERRLPSVELAPADDRDHPEHFSLSSPEGPQGGPREVQLGRPLPRAEGESNTPPRSITEESHRPKERRQPAALLGIHRPAQ